MITDIHAHLFHPSWYPKAFTEALVRDFIKRRQSAGQRISEGIDRQLLKLLTDDTGVATIRIMDKAGIKKRLIMIVDWGVELGEAEKSIWQIHEEILNICNQSSDRLYAFAGVDPRRKDAKDLIEWSFDKLGAIGLKLHPTGGWRLTDTETHRIVCLAAERNLPILIHLGKTVDVLNSANAHPKAFIELASQYPSIPFIAGHSGYDLWEVFLQIDNVPKNIYFDISGWQERIKGDGTNILNDLKTLNHKFPGRICFGTDSPFYSFNLVLSEINWVEKISPFIINTGLQYEVRKPNSINTPSYLSESLIFR